MKPGAKFVFQNGEAVIPLRESDIVVTIKGRNTPLGADDFEIMSVSDNRFMGTATVILRGKGEYGGTKTLTFKIGAMSL
jgi:hypothetical protein